MAKKQSTQKEQALPSKKPFYKKKSFIIIVIIFFAIIVNIISSSDTPSTASSGDSSGDETAVAKNDDSAKEAKTRDNSGAVATNLYTGQFVVGEDIPAGRYVITTSDAKTGNLFIYEGSLPYVSEMLGYSEQFNMGTPSVTTDIKDGNTIQISGLNDVIFTPADTVLRTELTTGNWIVGLDVPEGTYDATTTDANKTGNFVVYNNGLPTTNTLLGVVDSMNVGVEKVKVKLKDGNEIKIGALKNVVLTPVE